MGTLGLLSPLEVLSHVLTCNAAAVHPTAPHPHRHPAVTPPALCGFGLTTQLAPRQPLVTLPPLFH